MASSRIGARRHGKRSSAPAHDTISSVRCERAAPGAKVLHLAHFGRCEPCPSLLKPNRSSTRTETANPSTGTRISNQRFCLETRSSVALRIEVNATTSKPAIDPPNTAPSVESATVEGKDEPLIRSPQSTVHSPQSCK